MGGLNGTERRYVAHLAESQDVLLALSVPALRFHIRQFK